MWRPFETWASFAVLLVLASNTAASPPTAPKSGDALRLVVDQRRLVVTLVEVGSGGLCVKHGWQDSVRVIAWSEVQGIEARAPRSRLKGAGVGATYGFLGGLILFVGTAIAVSATPSSGEFGDLGGGLALAAVGAGALCLIPVGGLIGFVVPGSDWVPVPAGALQREDGRPPGGGLGLRLTF